MRIAVKDDIRLALTTLGRAKWRSGLTMLGVIIGVMSVILVVAIGAGARSQVAEQITQLSKNSVLVTANVGGDSSLLDNTSSGGLLQVKDVTLLRDNYGESNVTPVARVHSPLVVDGNKKAAPVWAVSADFANVFHKEFAYGGTFSDSLDATQGAVIGHDVALSIFGQEAPLGRSFTVLGQSFVVYGVLQEVPSLPWVRGVDFNKSVLISYDVTSFITKDTVQPSSIYIHLPSPTVTDEQLHKLETTLGKNRGGQQDFQILTHASLQDGADNTLSVITLAIIGIAIISLLVGGIGIMNVMFVSVSERIHEIGLRKAVGATNRQILRQFITEALVVSFIGGLIGALLAVSASILLGVYTNLDPIIDFKVVAIVLLVTVAVGALFGTIPAIKAARKDPIEALRHE
ncbi:MAG: ABC transporter permease [Candidatus Saccharimonadales bacterium]